MSAQHTPGPWKNARTADGKSVCFQVSPQPPTEHYVEPVNEEYRANMLLLDAAPDLLEALKLAHKALEAIADEMTVGERYTNAGQHLLESLEPSRAAIAKATGQKGGA